MSKPKKSTGWAVYDRKGNIVCITKNKYEARTRALSIRGVVVGCSDIDHGNGCGCDKWIMEGDMTCRVIVIPK